MFLEYSSFSSCGQFLAYCGPDGKLKIWETCSDTLKQEYTPNLHLTSPYTCFTWISTINSTSHKKKRRKSDIDGGLPSIVIGTQAGGLVFYSIAEGNIVSALNDGHRTPVQCLAWERDADLFSCSTEHFVHWDTRKKHVKSKWKNGEACSAMAVSQNGEMLVTASRSIKWWNVAQKTVVKTFTGHATPVVRLSVLCYSSNDHYVISAAQNDRLLSAWCLSETGPSQATSSFLMSDIVQSLSTHVSPDGLTSVGVVTQSGTLHLYCHQLNGKTKKPLKPSLSVVIASDTGQAKTKVQLLSIVTAALTAPASALVAYGLPPFLAFETISLEHPEKELCLVRKDPKTTLTGHQEAVTKVRVPEVSRDTHYLSGAVVNGSGVGVKRGAKGREAEVPMEQRLENLALDQPSSSQPRGESMANLLLQGLQSKDKGLLQSVLYKRDESAVTQTVQRLPVQAVGPLVGELVTLLQGKTFTSQTAAVWLRAVLSTHSAQLLADPEATDVFAPLLALVETRLGCRPALEQLRGRLDLVLHQATADVRSTHDADAPALLTLHDQDSTEEGSDTLGSEAEEDESEDRWDELSSDEDAGNIEIADSDQSS